MAGGSSADWEKTRASRRGDNGQVSKAMALETGADGDSACTPEGSDKPGTKCTQWMERAAAAGSDGSTSEQRGNKTMVPGSRLQSFRVEDLTNANAIVIGTSMAQLNSSLGTNFDRRMTCPAPWVLLEQSVTPKKTPKPCWIDQTHVVRRARKTWIAQTGKQRKCTR